MHAAKHLLSRGKCQVGETFLHIDPSCTHLLFLKKSLRIFRSSSRGPGYISGDSDFVAAWFCSVISTLSQQAIISQSFKQNDTLFKAMLSCMNIVLATKSRRLYRLCNGSCGDGIASLQLYLSMYVGLKNTWVSCHYRVVILSSRRSWRFFA